MVYIVLFMLPDSKKYKKFIKLYMALIIGVP